MAYQPFLFPYFAVAMGIIFRLLELSSPKFKAYSLGKGYIPTKLAALTVIFLLAWWQMHRITPLVGGTTLAAAALVIIIGLLPQRMRKPVASAVGAVVLVGLLTYTHFVLFN